MATHHTFIDGATDDVTSSHAEWTRGHITVFVEGTFGHNQTRVVVEASADGGTTFVPIDGLNDISEPMAKYWRITGHCHIRAKVTDSHDAPNAPNLTVRIV